MGAGRAVHSLKMMPQGVGTFSTIEDLILRTLIFRQFLDPRSLTPKARPALRKAGRTSSKSGSFASKSRPDHPRRVQKLASQRKARPALRKAGRTFQIRPQQKSATRLAKGRSPFQIRPPQRSATRLAEGRSHFQIRPPKRSATRLAQGRSHFSN